MTDEPTPEVSDRQREVLDLIRDPPAHLPDEPQSSDLADELGISDSSVKTHISRLRNKGFQIYSSRSNSGGYVFDPTELGDNDYADLADALHDGGATMAELTDEFDTSKASIRRGFDTLRQQGHTIEHKEIDASGERRFFIPEETDKTYQVGSGSGVYRFGLISDTHLGSEATHLAQLHDFYDRLEDRGITTVYHAGDIGDGWQIHPGHVNVIKGEASGWGRLKDYIVEHYPRRQGIDTLFIEGNHDNRYYQQNSIHFGQLLDNARSDLHYCGDSMARFVFDAEHDIDLELIHPSGGKPYTLGYRIMTLYRERPIDTRPTLAGIGHLHGSMFAQTHGVIGFYTGAWKGLTTYGKRKGHAAEIGGWIIEMEIEDGELRRLVPEWVGYEADDSTNFYSMTDVAELTAPQTGP